MNKKIPIKKFSFRIIVFSVIIAGLSVLFQWIWPDLATPALPFIVLFFFVITLFTIYIVLRNDNSVNQRQFYSGYMLSRIVKILSCLLFLGIYMYLNRNDALKFAIAFLIIYFLFSIFEVFLLKMENDDISKSKQHNNNENINQ